ncbi:DMT family transporter [Pseudorhodobacter ferrugineus]|uniref:DMT family transporter n=1 Tax=Pseudorhodobacter ferrugineus TaxID=77008 RepID=UPI0003B5AB92|nr:DMT family transporter [Pseudorhodobacter ferrugineus]
MKPTSEPVLVAAVLVLGFATVIGFTDNFVRVIAIEAGLWQFHVTRTLMIVAILALVARPLGLRMRPKRFGAVASRSGLHGIALMIYFGSLAFLPVAQVAAGLFTAPIFVLLISRFFYGRHIGIVRVLAVGIGFLGVAFVLGRDAIAALSLPALMPVVAGAFYAMGNIATRQWCGDETTETLTLGFFAGIGAFGLVGLIVLALFPVAVPEGAAGFVARGWVWPSLAFYWWTFVQAAGSLVAVAMLMRAYQIAEASRVSVFEYLNLPLAAFWGWVLWGEDLGLWAMLGMGMITAAGAMIALRANQSAELLPTA